MTVIKRFVDLMYNWQELVSTTVIWFKLWLMWTVMYAGKWDNSRKICAGMLLRFQWQIEKLWQELGLGQRYFSVSPLRLNMTKYNQRLCMNANRIQIEEILKTDKLINLVLIRSKFIKPSVMCCAIWYYQNNLRNVKNTNEGVLLLVKLQAFGF